MKPFKKKKIAVENIVGILIKSRKFVDILISKFNCFFPGVKFQTVYFIGQ